MEKIIKYPHPSDELTILWRPDICTHAGACVRTLPKVYKPKERPWCSPENASVEELINQIKKCPSGALGYELKGTDNLA